MIGSLTLEKKLLLKKDGSTLIKIIGENQLPAMGDINAQLLMIGLAPAAQCGNRTGRVFTGDKSADFLFKCLHKSGFANQSTSISRDDGLVLFNLYLTTALKCVPPEDKPKPDELKTCFKFFKEEISYLSKINTIVALGKIAFDACLNFYMQDYDIKRKDFVFFSMERNIICQTKKFSLVATILVQEM